jgi:hypothetical protein
LLGAQVIAEYERLQDGDTATLGELKTDLHASKWDDFRYLWMDSLSCTPFCTPHSVWLLLSCLLSSKRAALPQSTNRP